MLKLRVADDARHLRRLGADAGKLAGDGAVVGNVPAARFGNHGSDSLTLRQTTTGSCWQKREAG
jgi:hypothetical protein